jgi:hypothetical protein
MGDFDESDYSDDEEEEDPYSFAKPVFIPKDQRLSVLAKVDEERKQQIWDEKNRQQQLAKKEHTRSLVADVVRMSENANEDHDDANSESGRPDDSDDILEVRKYVVSVIIVVCYRTEYLAYFLINLVNSVINELKFSMRHGRFEKSRA